MKSTISTVAFFALPLTLAGCTPTPVDPSSTSDNLAGGSCTGGNTSIPDDGRYSLTTFGGPGDGQNLGCGGTTSSHTWYVASAQRFGCHARLQITAGGNCVVAEVLDCGPAAWVEKDAGNPIIDASPSVAQQLFGVSSAGWSEHASRQIVAQLVDSSTPLGTCTASQSEPTPAPMTDPSTAPSTDPTTSPSTGPSTGPTGPSSTDPSSTDPTPTDPGSTDPSNLPATGVPCAYYDQSMPDGYCYYASDGYSYLCNNGNWQTVDYC
jgi:hypothetical protein